MASFSELGLPAVLQSAVAACGYATPTPVQARAIPPMLAGRDLLVRAPTGTGKTAAFALPLLARLEGDPPGTRTPRALILAPTRELAVQLGQSLRTYAGDLGVRVAVVHGGVDPTPQIEALAAGVEVLVATPGRLLDLLDRGHAQLARVASLVLDEADRMLDLGFLPDVRRVLDQVPSKRQTALVSATLPDPVQALAEQLLRDPVAVEVSPERIDVAAIQQRLYYVTRADKKRLLAELLSDPTVTRALVFVRTREGVDRVAGRLVKAGIAAEVIHGDKGQVARQRALEAFRDGDCRVLVATDVAARGLDVDEVSHVLQHDLPREAEVYVHRVGRTGRAGRGGVALALCAPEEIRRLKAIERLTGRPLRPMTGHPWHCEEAMLLRDAADKRSQRGPKPKKRGGRGGRGGRRGGRGRR